MTNLEFLTEGIKNLKTVGTVLRTSKYVSRSLLEHIDFSTVKLILELGAGDGAITKHILSQLAPNGKLIVFEVNPIFCQRLKQVVDSRLIVIQDGAENMQEHFKTLQIKEVDAIISAIPFVMLPDELSHNILQSCVSFLKKNGVYLQIHYSLAKKKMYEKYFSSVHVDFIPLNIPPVFVLKCKQV